MHPVIAHRRQLLALARRGAAALILVCSHAVAQVWTPLSTGTHPRSVEFFQSSVLPVPASVLAKGGTLRVLLVGGGEGGHAARSSCDELALQGGRGGDGGEVVEFDVPLAPGQCAAGLVITIGERGRGALRSGNGTLSGETGGTTSIGCGAATVAYALGGGRRPDPVTAARAVRGAAGAVLLLASGTATAPAAEPRLVAAAAAGQNGHLGYGSSGGGGGLTWTSASAAARNVPMGPGGHGAGAGAGPPGYAAALAATPAQNAVQYGAGGGGGPLSCGSSAATNRDAGNGAPGYARVTWSE